MADEKFVGIIMTHIILFGKILTDEAN